MGACLYCLYKLNTYHFCGPQNRPLCVEWGMNKGIGCKPRTVTAAVSVEAVSIGESQSLGKSGKAGYGRRSVLLSKCESEDLQKCSFKL